MRITFKGKIKEHRIYVAGSGYKVVTGVKMPAITKSHCDMNAFRVSRRFGSYANSDLFGAILGKALRELDLPEIIEIDDLPDNVTVKAGFLAIVEIEIEDNK